MCELLNYFILVCASACVQTIHCKNSTDMLFGLNSWICSDCCALRSFQELNRSEVILRALPHISGYFWIRKFFFPNWKSFPSTRSVFKSNRETRHTCCSTGLLFGYRIPSGFNFFGHFFHSGEGIKKYPDSLPNSMRVDGSRSRNKKLRILKYPNACGQGLILI